MSPLLHRAAFGTLVQVKSSGLVVVTGASKTLKLHSCFTKGLQSRNGLTSDVKNTESFENQPSSSFKKSASGNNCHDRVKNNKLGYKNVSASFLLARNDLHLFYIVPKNVSSAVCCLNYSFAHYAA